MVRLDPTQHLCLYHKRCKTSKRGTKSVLFVTGNVVQVKIKSYLDVKLELARRFLGKMLPFLCFVFSFLLCFFY